MTTGKRTCKVCNVIKDLAKFQPQGYQCRECRNEKSRVYWAALPEEERKKRQKSVEYQQQYREKNLEKVKLDSRNRHLKRMFGITLDEYDELLQQQNGVCAICNNTCATEKNLAVDHDHATGKVRALLCKNCNTAIGLLGEDTDRMAKAIEYIQSHSERIS